MSYSVGMFAFDHPELVFVGLPATTAAVLVNDLGARVRSGQRFTDGQVLDDLLAGGYLVQLIRARRADVNEYLGVAKVLSAASGRESQVEALQAVYQDSHGAWPWVEGSGVAAMLLLGPSPAGP